MFFNYLAVIAIILFASFVLTQTNTTTLDPNSVALALRTQWCQGQLNTCGILCNGDNIINTCTSSTLLYSCTCAAPLSTPDLTAYKETIPTFICEQLFTNCVTSAAGNASAQADCKTNIEDHCGTLDPSSLNNSGFSQGKPASSSSQITGSTGSSISKGSTSIVISTGLPTLYGKTTTSTSTPLPSSTKTQPPTHDPANIPTSTSPSISISTATLPTLIPLSPSPGSGRNTGIGIGIGVTIGVILLCLCIHFFLRKRRRKQARARAEEYPKVPELSSNGILEIPQLETKERPGELHGDGVVRERGWELE